MCGLFLKHCTLQYKTAGLHGRPCPNLNRGDNVLSLSPSDCKLGPRFSLDLYIYLFLFSLSSLQIGQSTPCFCGCYFILLILYLSIPTILMTSESPPGLSVVYDAILLQKYPHTMSFSDTDYFNVRFKGLILSLPARLCHHIDKHLKNYK